MTDLIRAAAERLLQQLETRRTDPEAPLMLEQAENDLRTALAHPEPAGEVTDDQIEAEFRSWFKDTYGDRYYGAIPLAVLIPWTRHKLALSLSRRAPVPPNEGEVAELVEWLKEESKIAREDDCSITAAILSRIAALLEHHQPPQPVAVDEPEALYEYHVFNSETDEEQAQGVALTLEQAQREGNHYLAIYSEDGPHHLELRRAEVIYRTTPPEAES